MEFKDYTELWYRAKLSMPVTLNLLMVIVERMLEVL